MSAPRLVADGWRARVRRQARRPSNAIPRLGGADAVGDGRLIRAAHDLQRLILRIVAAQVEVFARCLWRPRVEHVGHADRTTDAVGVDRR